MKLYIHKKTIRYFDYGSPLGESVGIAWSADGLPENATGFEPKTIGMVRAKFASLGAAEAGFELIEGPAVTKSCDMNPRGDI